MNPTTASPPEPSTACVTTRDEAILSVLECYLSARTGGPVNKAQFIADQTESLSQLDLKSELPGLLASVDAAHGFQENDPWSAESLSDPTCVWEDLVSKTLGDFEILAEIGRGGMGVVYRAKQVSLDRFVALKVLPLAVVLDKQQIARFSVEAQAAGQLHHPHIVPIYWVGREEGIHCYSMPLIEGKSLDRIIEDQIIEDQQSPRSNLSRAITWMKEASLALHHAHQNGVIHRDIKPSNLLIDESNKLWVTDFGLARLGGTETLTRSGAVVGTFRYMSPEQASGNPAMVDHRGDIYGLGVTFYELLTGRKLFGDSIADETAARFRSTAIAPRRVNPRIPRDLETILLKTLAVDPIDRYESAESLADDLTRCLDGRPVLARRPSLIDRTGKWILRHGRSVAFAIAAGFILLLASLATTARFAAQGQQLKTALDLADDRLSSSESNRRIAEDNFRETQQVLDHFGLMAAEQLRGIAGAQPVREQLVKDLLLHYEDRVAKLDDNPELIGDVIQTHLRAAKIIEELGATERARSTYERALELMSLQPQTPTIAYQIASCQSNVALLTAELGETDDAIEIYQQSIPILTSLSIGDRGRTHSLAGVHANFGLLLSAMNRSDEAKARLMTSVGLLPPENERTLPESRTAAMVWNNLTSLTQDSDLPLAIQYNERSIAVLQAARRTDPDDPELIRSLALSRNNEASLKLQADEHRQAIDAFQEAIGLYRKIVQSHPTAVRYAEELAITYNNYARCLHAHGETKRANEAFVRSQDLLKFLVRKLPEEQRYRDALEGVSDNLAKTMNANFNDAQTTEGMQ